MNTLIWTALGLFRIVAVIIAPCSVKAYGGSRLPTPSWKSDDAGVALTFKYGQRVDASDLNRRQKKLLLDLGTGDSIKLPVYQDQYMVSERQGRRDLKELVEAGYLNREGDGPTTVFVRLDRPLNPAKPGQD